MSENEESEKEIKEKRKVEAPKDLHSIYMEDRRNLSEAIDEYDTYKLLRSLIDTGKEMLPSGYESLKKETEDILNNKKYYPGNRQMEIYSEDRYKLKSLEDKTTGTVLVMREDLEHGIREMNNQQASNFNPILKDIDNKILNALVKKGIVEVKRPDIKEELRKKLQIKLMKKMEVKSADSS